MSYLDFDPPDAAAIRDAKAERWLESRPVCDHCGEAIQEEYMFEVGGKHYCEECFDYYIRDGFKVPVPEEQYEEGF